MTKSDVDIGHGLFLQFCKKAEVLYGHHFITPNMHLHLHLWDCVLDYGSPYSFWCFAFERCNYVMQHIHTNKRDPEIQLMKQVEKENHLFSLRASSAHPEQLLHMKYTFDTHISVSSQDSCINSWKELESIVLPQNMINSAVRVDDLAHLLQCYRAMYPYANINDEFVQKTYQIGYYMTMASDKYSSVRCRRGHNR